MLGKFTAVQVGVWAGEFAAKVPECEFTPAEIQGYLLNYKTDPEGAIEGVDKWVEETRVKKAQLANVKLDEEKKEENKETEKKHDGPNGVKAEKESEDATTNGDAS
jgi:chaperone BCS1